MLNTWALIGNCRAGGVPVALSAHPWPEAERLFHLDSHWLGADDAHSVDLGKGRVLWLFGDTFIDRHGNRNRSHADLIHNSIGIQNGYNPAEADMTFFWKRSGRDMPASFFSASQDTWYWPGDGIRIGQHVLIFLMAIQTAPNPLGFGISGWRAVLIDNPDDTPDDWNIVEVMREARNFDIIPGSGGVLANNGFVYAYGCSTSGSRSYLARWPEDTIEAGDLRGTRWWCGQRLGWLADKQIVHEPAVLFTDAQSEFGVYHDAGINRYVQIQTMGFGAADLGFRTAPCPEGPWSALTRFYEPHEKNIPGVMIYAAKPHGFLTGTSAVLTYATNHTDPDRLIDFPTLYYPRVLQTVLKIGTFE